MTYNKCGDMMIFHVMDHLSISYNGNTIMVWWNLKGIDDHLPVMVSHDGIGLYPDIESVDEI